MSVSLYLGPYQPFLEDGLLKEMARIRAVDPLRPVNVITPNFLLTRHLRFSLSREQGSLFNVRFSTYHQAVEEWSAGKAAQEGFQRLPDSVVPWALRSIGRFPEGSVFEKVQDTPGFHKALAGTLIEAQESCLDAGTIESAADRHSGSGRWGQASRKWSELAGVLRAYREWKRKNRRYDARDAARWAVEGGDRDGEAVFVYGFYDPTVLQRRLLEKKAGKPDCAWFIPYEERTACDYAKPFVDWARERADRVFMPAVTPSPNGDLESLKRRLFEKDAPPDPRLQGATGPEVRVLLCHGETMEMAEAADALAAEVGKTGGPFREAAVLFRVSEPFRKTAPSVFEDRSLPVENRLKRPLLETPQGKAAGLLLACFEEDFPRQQVMGFLCCPAVRPESLGVPDEDWNPEAWDALTKRAGITRGRGLWLDRLNAMSAPGDDASEAEGQPRAYRAQSGRLSGIMTALFSLREEMAREKGLKAKARKLGGILGGIFEPCPETDGLLDALTDLQGLGDGPGFLDKESFAAVVLSVWEGKTLGEARSTEGGVRFLELMEARGVPHDFVLLPGLWERSVPVVPRPDPLLLDEERELLNGAAGVGDVKLPLKRDRRLEERFLFYQAVCSARKAVFLTASIMDPGNGNPRTPSPYLFQALEALSGTHSSDLERSPFVTVVRDKDRVKGSLPQCSDMKEVLAMVMDRARRGEPAPALAWAKRFEFYFPGRDLWAARQFEPSFTRFDGVFADPSALERLRHSLEAVPGAFSATRLETYATCPQRYYFRYMLSLETLDEPEEEISVDPAAKGNLAHQVLEEVLREGAGSGWLKSRDVEAGRASLGRVAGRLFPEFVKRTAVGSTALWENDSRRLLEDLDRVLLKVLRDMEWIPLDFEKDFGTGTPEGGEASFELPSGRVLRLKGRIDRVDLDEAGGSLRIVDYKSGTAVDYADQRVKGGSKIQLPLYLWAARRLYPGLKPVLAQYDFFTDRGGYLTRNYRTATPEERGELDGVLAKVLGTVDDGTHNGFFAPTAGMKRSSAASQSADCRNCDFSTLCGTGMEGRARRKRSDPRADAYYSVRDLK